MRFNTKAALEPNDTQKQKAFAYIRSSQHSNAETAVENQKQMLAEYCEAQGYELQDSECSIGDKHLGCEKLLQLIDRAEAEGVERIVIASVNRVAATPEEIQIIKEHLEGKNVHIETKDGTIVLFDYADADESPEDMSFELTMM